MPLKSFISWLRGENADVTATDALANPTSPTPSSPPQANLSYQRLEPKLVLNASFALDAFGFLSLDDFVDSTPADNDLTISQSASTFSFVLNDGVWNGTDATGLTGNGTDTLAINLSDVSLNSISIDSNTTDQFDIEFGALSFAGDLNIESTGATAFGSITQTDSIKIGGTASFLSATEIVMTHAANDFLGTVNAASDNIQLTDQNDLQLGAITATGDLTVTSTDVEVTAIGTVNGLARFVNSSTDTMNLGADVGGEFSLTNAELSNITATDGFQFISNNENVVVDGINQATDVEIIAGTGNVNFDGAASSISSMTVSSSTAIGQSAEINVAGIASFTADNNIILNDLDNDFQDTVNADGGNVDLADANNIELGNVNTTTLNVAALNTGAITQNNSGINVASTASFTAADDDITLNTASNDFQGTVNTNGANVDLTDANSIQLGDIDAATLDVTALSTGEITQDNSGITIAGDASFTATDDDITLNTTSNDFLGTVNANGANVDLTDANDIELGDIDAATVDVTALGAGDITQDNSGITVAGDASFTATDDDITLDTTSNDFQGTVNANGANVDLTDANSIELGDIDAATLDVTALSTGDITQDNSGISVTGDASFTATDDDITLNTTSNDFQGTVNANGANVDLTDANSIELGDIDAATLDVTALGTGEITQDNSGITVTGDTSLTATDDDITLNTASNDFQGSVNANGANVDLTDANNIELGDVDAATLDVTALGAGDITQDNSGITVTGDASLTATDDDITLNTAINDFQGTVNANGANVDLTDANSIELGDVDAATLDVTVLSTGDITQDNSGITVTGDASLTATDDDITLNTASNDFQGTVNANGANVDLTDANSIQLGDVDAATLDATALSTGDITQDNSGITVTGDASFTATDDDITLNTASNDFQGNVNAEGANVDLTDANSIQLGDIDAATLDVTALSTGEITQDNSGITVTGDASFTATDDDITLNTTSNDFQDTVNADGANVDLTDANSIELGDIDAATLDVTALSTGDITQDNSGITVTGDASLTATDDDITLNTASNDFQGSVNANGANVDLTDANSIELGDIDAATLDVTALGAGEITQDNSGITVTGDASLTATDDDITLNTTSNDFQGTVNANGGNVDLTDANSIELGDIDAATLDVTALGTGEITQDNSGITVTGDASFTSTDDDITLNTASNDFQGTVNANGANVDLTDANSIELGDIDAATLDVTALSTGDITQDNSGITATGDASFTATDDDITLNTASNDFQGTVNADGANVDLTDANSIQLADIDAATLDVTALSTGEITQDNSGITVTGDANFMATDDDITLNTASNDFKGSVNANGANVDLTDANSIELGDIDAATLDVTALGAGEITQDNSGITVTGDASFTATDDDITLNTASNDFQGTVNANGANVDLTDANSIQLGDIDAATLDVTALGTGEITQDNSGITVIGDASFTATDDDITLNTASNDFQGSVNANGANVDLTDANSIQLGDIDAATLDVTALGAGEITQDNSGITVTGDTSLTATDDDITLNTTSNDFQGTINANGANIDLTDANSIELGDIDAATLDVMALSTGEIIQDNSGITVTGEASFTATDDDITLNTTSNDFQGTVNANGANVDLTDANNIELGDVDAATLDVTALGTGEITQDNSGITVTGDASFTAIDDDITLNTASNDFQGTVNANGANVDLTDANSIQLGDIDAATLDVTALSTGDITQDNSGITVAGEASFTATDDDITLNTTSNDFQGTINANGANIDLTDANSIELGDIDAAKLDVTALGTGEITQDTSGITITGDASFTATDDDITLNTASNDFQGTVNADGANVDLTDANSIQLGDIDAETLDVMALSTGDITQDNSGITVTGDSSLTATDDDITLNTTSNDFQGTVNANGANVDLTDANSIQLGDIGAAKLDVTALGTGEITQDNSGITVTGDASFTATDDDITLNTASNDFQGTVNADGANVDLTDANSIQLGDIDAETLDVMALSTGDITQGNSGITVTGDSSLTATDDDITLNTTSNDFQGTVNANGANVDLTDANSIQLGDIGAAKLDVTALGTGEITQDNSGITVTGDASFTATDDDITLNTASNDFQGTVNANGANVDLTDANNIELGNVDAATLDVTALGTGEITQDNSGITVTGEANFTATDDDITLNTTSNDFQGTINANGANIDLTDANSIELGDIDAATLDVMALSTGEIIQDNSGITVTGDASFTATDDDITLNTTSNDFQGTVNAKGANVDLTDANSLELGDVDAATLDVTALGTGEITQDNSGITVTGEASFTATDDDITLNTTSNDFQGTVNANGANIDLTDANNIELGNVDAATLDITALGTGEITQNNSGIAVTGEANLTATDDDITLNTTSNDFQGTVNAKGANVDLTDANSLELGDVDAATLDSTALGTGEITQDNSGITVTGEASFTATDDNITLNTTSNDFQGTVNANGANIDLTDANNIELGNVDAATLDITALGTGEITQNNSGIAVTGEANLTATDDDITLNTTSNDFQGTVNANGANVDLTDANSIQLGDIDAATLDVTALGAGDITQDNSGITVTGEASFTATDDDITLNTTSNDFLGTVNANGANVDLTDANSIELGDVDAATLDITALSTGEITQDTSGITVTGDANLTATDDDITLNTTSNDFQGTVNASGANVDLTDANSIELGDIDAATLDVTALGTGEITQDNSGITVTGDTSLTATDDDITLNTTINDFQGTVNANGANVDLTDANSIQLGDIDAATLDATALGAGDITQDNSGITVTGEASFTATDDDITLNTTSNDFQGTVNANGANVDLTDANSIELGDIDAATLDVTALNTGDITQDNSGITVTGEASFTATDDDITLNTTSNDFQGTVNANGANVDLTDANSIELGDIDAATLDVTALGTGEITQDNSGITVTGDASFTSTDDDITLNTASNDFQGTVNANGANVDLTDANSIQLGDIDAATLDVTALGTGEITQDNSGITVTGDASFTATDDDITLNTTSNDFQGTVNANGANVDLTDANSIELGDIDAATLDVTALGTGEITQDNSGITVTGDASFTATDDDITLNTTSNDFQGTVNANGANVDLTDANSIELGDIDAATLDVTALGTGEITQDNSGIKVTGDASFTATDDDITLNTTSNDFQGTVNANGANVDLIDANDIELGDVDAATLDATALSTGDITQDNSGITVAGEASFTATDDDITLNTTSNDFQGTVNANGANVDLADSNSIELGEINAGEDLAVTVINGEITDKTDSRIIVSGDAAFVASDKITLADKAQNLLQVEDNASFTATTVAIGRDLQPAGTPTAMNTLMGSLTIVATDAFVVEDDATQFAGTSQIDDLYLASASDITNELNTSLNVIGHAQFVSPTQIILGNQMSDHISIAQVGLVTPNVHLETDSNLVIDGSVPDQSTPAFGLEPSRGTEVQETLFVKSTGAVTQIVGKLDAKSVGIQAEGHVHLAKIDSRNEAIAISAGTASALTDADMIQELRALDQIENSEVRSELPQSIAIKHEGILNVTSVDSHLGTSTISGLHTTDGGIFSSSVGDMNLIENIDANSPNADPQITLFSEAGSAQLPGVHFHGGIIQVNGPTNAGIVNANQTTATFFDSNGEVLTGTTEILLLAADGTAVQNIVIDYGHAGESGYRVGVVWDRDNQFGAPVEVINTFVSDPTVATEAYDDAIYNDNPNTIHVIGGNEGGRETFPKIFRYTKSAIIAHNDEPKVFSEVTVRNDQDINLFSGNINAATNSLNEISETLQANLDVPKKFAPDLPTINAINPVELKSEVILPLSSTSQEISNGFSFSRDVQPFETGELKWVQVVIPISELEDSDGDVRLKDPTQNFGQSESAEIFKLDGEIGENEVDKIINAIETNQESEAGYWYKVFKDYRNRDDELFFYHYKTGDAQETTPEPIDASEGSKEQPEPSPESPNLNLQNDSETLPTTEAGLSDSDSEMEIVPKLNSSNLEQNEAELTPPSSQDNANVTAPNRGSSLSAASLLMATLLVKKSKNKPTAHESSKPESNESLNHESQAPIVGFSRLDRLKRKVKRHLG